jgi:4-hydroxy-tetrahydrodipicolinate reductase
MRIALIGYGKMGKEVEQHATERGWSVTLRLTSKSSVVSEESATGTDVAIHFASPASVLDSVATWTGLGKPMVIGTTGWMNRLDEVRKTVGNAGTGMIYGANFSPGVHIFARLVEEAASLADRFPGYDIALREIHHAQKIDSPSGTALMLGNILLKRIRRKSEILTAPASARIAPHQVRISSERFGTVVGTHTLTLDSLSDSLELTHAAKNRAGFALGALMAAEWIRARTGVYSVEEMMAELLDT